MDMQSLDVEVIPYFRITNKLTSRWDCCMSPCNARAPRNKSASSAQEFFVSVKIMVRPPLNPRRS